MNKNYYEILEVSRNNFSETELKKKYHVLLRKYHPSYSKDKANEKLFQEVQAAYEILSNKKSKAEYDEWLDRGGRGDYSQRYEAQMNSGNFFGGGFNPFGEEAVFTSTNNANNLFGNILEQFFGGFTGSSFNEQMSHNYNAVNMPSAVAKVHLTLQEACYGFKKVINYEYYRECNCITYNNKSSSIGCKCFGKGYVILQNSFILGYKKVSLLKQSFSVKEYGNIIYSGGAISIQKDFFFINDYILRSNIISNIISFFSCISFFLVIFSDN